MVVLLTGTDMKKQRICAQYGVPAGAVVTDNEISTAQMAEETLVALTVQKVRHTPEPLVVVASSRPQYQVTGMVEALHDTGRTVLTVGIPSATVPSALQDFQYDLWLPYTSNAAKHCAIVAVCAAAVRRQANDADAAALQRAAQISVWVARHPSSNIQRQPPAPAAVLAAAEETLKVYGERAMAARSEVASWQHTRLGAVINFLVAAGDACHDHRQHLRMAGPGAAAPSQLQHAGELCLCLRVRNKHKPSMATCG